MKEMLRFGDAQLPLMRSCHGTHERQGAQQPRHTWVDQWFVTPDSTEKDGAKDNFS